MMLAKLRMLGLLFNPGSVKQVGGTMQIESLKKEDNGKQYIEGSVKNSSGQPLAGTHVIWMGTTRGLLQTGTAISD
jgi:hypothetical protein